MIPRILFVIFFAGIVGVASFFLIQKPITLAPESPTFLGDDLIKIYGLEAGALISSPFVVRGEARGYWFFEASFPVRLFDASGNEITVAIAQADGEWMTEDFVSFEAKLIFEKPSTSIGRLVFQKDNPSGLPEYDDSFTVPVRF